jgi:hypothetical protein
MFTLKFVPGFKRREMEKILMNKVLCCVVQIGALLDYLGEFC